MVTTPIRDFCVDYAQKAPVRMHMPGHKGRGFLGFEQWDLTEIDEADDLYHADGIIAESEENASKLFGCRTFYSTEGSSLCIRAMLFLALNCRKDAGPESFGLSHDPKKRPWILAGRNAHKVFMYSAALLDFDIDWIRPSEAASYHSCPINAAQVEKMLKEAAGGLPAAVYLTSPDYLGNLTDIKGIAEVCHRYGVPLLVDNAHGAYLHFLKPSLHPMDLGADLCCDSAHKTFPVITGGAYLHMKKGSVWEGRAKEALGIFGSTSPSYLIMQSLDVCNPWLEALPHRLEEFLPKLDIFKERLRAAGYELTGDEPMKVTIKARLYGYTGTELAQILAEHNIYVEFHDPDFVVLMPTPETTETELEMVGDVLCKVERKAASGPDSENLISGDGISGEHSKSCPALHISKTVLSPRQAMFAPQETLPVEDCLGRIFASAALSCPPAIPILYCGEIVDEEAVRALLYYGITECKVVKN